MLWTAWDTNYLPKHFDRVGQGAFRLKDGPRQMVAFQLLNFADDARMRGRRGRRGYHVIFCRNALIYFDREAKRRFAAHFCNNP